MSYSITSFPQFEDQVIFVTLVSNLSKDVIKNAKQQIITGNKEYDFCFLNSTLIVSLEQLYNSVHKSILNYNRNCMTARTLNTEIIFGLSPMKSITEALKKFGIDEECPNLIVIKVLEKKNASKEKLDGIIECLSRSFACEGMKISKLEDDVLFEKLLDIKKFKKMFKLNDINLETDKSKLISQLTELSIYSSHLRGC